MRHVPASKAKEFQEEILRHYRTSGRDFSWRKTRDPYHIFVSEIMLQQTGTARVAAKFPAFVSRFPGFGSLASASLTEVLSVWQGMGYNRRALALIKSARMVMEEFNGSLPRSVDDLEKLPGVGKATASAIAAFAYDEPTVFVETNIRAVFIHFFFPGDLPVYDRDILPLVKETLVRACPREWYYALMDYGAMLKSEGKDPGRKSAHHRKQAPFKGSMRQLRGRVLRVLMKGKAMTGQELSREVNADPERLYPCVGQLQREGFISEEEGTYSLAGGPDGEPREDGISLPLSEKRQHLSKTGCDHLKEMTSSRTAGMPSSIVG